MSALNGLLRYASHSACPLITCCAAEDVSLKILETMEENIELSQMLSGLDEKSAELMSALVKVANLRSRIIAEVRRAHYPPTGKGPGPSC